MWGWASLNLTQLESATESHTSGSMWFAVLLRDGPKRDLPRNGSHPKSSSFDATQTLVSRTAWREVQKVSIVATGAHST